VQSIDQFAEKLEDYSQEQRERILRAARLSASLHQDQYRESGEPYFMHPLQVTEILVDLRMDPDTLVAALLHDVLEDTRKSPEDLRSEFGAGVEQLVQGVTKIAAVKAKNRNVQAAENIRKILFAMVKDIRVILIKLADKLHNMRTLEYKKEARRRAIAQETLDIYAPLAGRLGISSLKDELEDLSLKHLHPDTYEQIKDHVAQKKYQRSDYLKRVQDAIHDAAEKENIRVDVEARAKHFYSIYQKMKRRNKSIEEIFDLLGIRILCESESECYTMLGIVHRLWPPIEGRFKDYIAMPKANKYQSLHTTVLCYGGKLIEIQIRTEEMHKTAEYGIAAHWLYKSANPNEQLQQSDLAIINRVKEFNGFRITSSEFLDEIKRELLKDSIYVFTPKGDAIQLPNGATPIDFAYHIHTEVGNHTSGAKADGAIVPLRHELKNTQVVEILTSPQARPHVNWLRYVKTTRARSKIRHWLNKHEEDLIVDRNIVARRQPQQGHGQGSGAQEQKKRRQQERSEQKQAEQKEQQQQQQQKPASQPETEPEHLDEEQKHIIDHKKVGVRIGNERNVMIRFARCCNPTTGDPIIGYISRGRGIIVHRKDCQNLKHIEDLDQRTIQVEWETVSPKATRRFKVTAKKTFDLFSEIEGAVRKYHGHLIEGKIEEMDNGNLEASFTMELERQEDVKRVMKSIRTVPAILNIQRAG
jgi:GTP pyrophosphokinase